MPRIQLGYWWETCNLCSLIMKYFQALQYVLAFEFAADLYRFELACYYYCHGELRLGS